MKPSLMYVGVKAVIIDQKKLLILKREDGVDGPFWDLPGGRLEASESIEAGLSRELQEELLGIPAFTIGKLIHARKRQQPIADGHELCLLYYQVSVPPFTVKLSPEHSQYQWANQAQLNEYPDPLGGIYSNLLELK